jgi:DNA-binding transcriptional ArsR family regulator
MLADADLSAVADLMTAHRGTMLLALLGGRPLTAGELAGRAGISASLASSHLSKLLDGGLVTVTQSGRERHYRLAGPHVAEVMEAMLTIAPGRAAATLRESARGEALRGARTCYDHLAGALGVALTESLASHHVIEPGDGAYSLTASGERRLASLGIDAAALREERRAFARPCLDWTVRRPHLAGSLGAAIARHALGQTWLRPLPGTRALRVTDQGRRGFLEEFGLNLPGS